MTSLPSKPSAKPPFGMVLYVCPDCGDYADSTASGYPLHSSCEYQDHRQAEAVEVIPVSEHEKLRAAATAVADGLAGELNLCAQDGGCVCSTCTEIIEPALKQLREALKGEHR